MCVSRRIARKNPLHFGRSYTSGYFLAVPFCNSSKFFQSTSFALTMGYASIFLVTQCQRCVVAHTRCTDWQIYSSRRCTPVGLHHLASTFIQIHEGECARPSFRWLNFRPFRPTTPYSVCGVCCVSVCDATKIHFSFSKRFRDLYGISKE